MFSVKKGHLTGGNSYTVVGDNSMYINEAHTHFVDAVGSLNCAF